MPACTFDVEEDEDGESFIDVELLRGGGWSIAELGERKPAASPIGIAPND